MPEGRVESGLWETRSKNQQFNSLKWSCGVAVVEQLLLFTEVCVCHLSVSCLTCPLSAGSFSLVLPEAHPSPLSVLSTSREGRERESPATQGKIRGLPLPSHVESPSALQQSGKPFVGVSVLPYL